MDREFVDKRRKVIVRQLIALLNEGKLSSDRANALVGRLAEVEEIEREQQRRVGEEIRRAKNVPVGQKTLPPQI